MPEEEIEQLTIELLENAGYQYFHSKKISPYSDTPERKSFEDVLLIDRLREAVSKINPSIPENVREDAIKQIQRLNSSELITKNETFHRMLTEGVNVSIQKDGNERGDLVWLIDFKNPANNDFLVVNQFTVIENNNKLRPDLIIFVNGLPLIVIELKSEKITIFNAYQQIQTYKNFIPTLLKYNSFIIISDGLDVKVGSISAEFKRYMTWKTPNNNQIKGSTPLNVLIDELLNKKVLLDYIRHFIVFEQSKITIQSIKKIATYHQYYAVNKAVESTLKASGFLKVNGKLIEGDRKGGVIWHTQGSGKSLSMVFYAGKVILALDNPTILVITDRNDLDDQLFDTFASSKQLLRQEPVQANDRSHLKKLLKVESGGVVFSTIQKFNPEEGNIYETLSERKNIIVMADEAHRTQYGFKAKTVDDKNDKGETIGKKIVYGFAKYMRDALPNATYIGFTGTPIEKTDVNTPAVFGNYIDIYDIAQAVLDGATVNIYYESRLAKVELSDEGKRLVEKLDRELEQEELEKTKKAKTKWTQLEALIGSKNRIKKIAKDITDHFDKRQEVFEGKAMIVAMSRRIAVDLYDEMISIKPEWHNDDLKKGVIKVVMTSSSSDGPKIYRHHTTKEQRRGLAERMKNPDDPLKLVIVRDMWLTGFDVPCMHTIYIDKPMQGHNLIQSISRVNRVYRDKPGGLVVDYLGVATDLKKALSFYSDSGGRGDPATVQNQAAILMMEKYEIVIQMFHGFPYKDYITADTNKKLAIILSAEEHILGLEDGKKRYIQAVTELSKAFSISMPHERAMDIKDEVSFFQAVKARLIKFNVSGKSFEEIETTIKQVIDKALVTEKVVDVFDAAGIKKPDISILSDEFLLEVKNMEHKNIALEVLKKLLNDEIKSRSRKNLVQTKSFMDMLRKSIQRYHSKIITASQVIDELINLGKNIKSMDKEHEEMGLSDYEYAFYTAVADNKSAREVMKKDKLRKLAIVLFEKVKSNASIDWTVKESVRAKLKVIVKRTLKKYGYPPDMQKLATETVLKQAELIADELLKGDS